LIFNKIFKPIGDLKFNAFHQLWCCKKNDQTFYLVHNFRFSGRQIPSFQWSRLSLRIEPFNFDTGAERTR